MLSIKALLETISLCMPLDHFSGSRLVSIFGLLPDTFRALIMTGQMQFLDYTNSKVMLSLYQPLYVRDLSSHMSSGTLLSLLHRNFKGEVNQGSGQHSGYVLICLCSQPKKTYWHYLASYRNFCKQMGIPLIPLTPINLGRYIAFLSSRLSFRSMRQYVSIVRLLHVEAGYRDPNQSHIISLIKGAKRELGDTAASYRTQYS